MKRKMIAFITLIATIMLITLSSCGNRDYVDLEWDTYSYVHCLATGECYEIDTWTNMDVGIKVNTRHYGILYFSEGTYILVGRKCPLCEHNNK